MTYPRDADFRPTRTIRCALCNELIERDEKGVPVGHRWGHIECVRNENLMLKRLSGQDQMALGD